MSTLVSIMRTTMMSTLVSTMMATMSTMMISLRTTMMSNDGGKNPYLALSPSKEGRHFWSDGQKTFSHGSLMHGPEM